jgi:xanthine dehydrogenase YagS FAD-binding subunit
MRPFAYAAAASPEAAIARVAAGGDRDYIAGGTDMLQLLQEGVRAPAELVDINPLTLRGVERSEEGLRIGALTRMADVERHPEIEVFFPAVSQALLASASPQVRNMATIGGNLLQRTRCLYFRDVATPCNKRAPGSGCPAQDGLNRMNAIFGGSAHCIATHASDLAVALTAFDALVETQGRAGRRRLPLAEFYRLPGETPHLETVLDAGELITAVILPHSAAAEHSLYLKLRDRGSFEFALVSAAVGLEIADGRVEQARIAAGGVGTRPWRLPAVERALIGSVPTADSFHAAASRSGDGAAPRGQNGFKPALLARTVERALLVLGGLA